MSRLWSTYSNTTVYGWQEILEEWHDSLEMPPHVETLIENLKAASNPDADFPPPLSQFLTYLNHEEAGLVWLLYELVAHRWMWSNIRLDYVRDLVDEIENLDGCFPRFPGSPWTSKTIRQWLNENLTADELAQIEMMPPLEAPPSSYYSTYSYQTPQRTARTEYTAPPAPQRLPRSYAVGGEQVPVVKKAKKPTHPSIMLLLQREGESDKTDDKIHVLKDAAYDSYTLSYTDGQAKMKFVNYGLTRTKVVESIRKMLRFLTIDEKPFDYLQVSVPSMPTILVKPENLTSQTRDLIYDSLESTMDDWPLYI